MKEIVQYNNKETSFKSLSDAAEKIGLRARGVEISWNQLTRECRLPCILHWNNDHFVVMVSYSPFRNAGVLIADPALGKVRFNKKDFEKHWCSVDVKGFALLLEPSKEFFLESGERSKRIGWSLLTQYLKVNIRQIIQIFIALLISTILQFIFPLLTQSIVDNGINNQDLSFISLILVAQLTLTFSKTIVDFIRTRILLKLSMVINLSILSDFWIKLTRLPMSFFDKHPAGEIFQRISDHLQIQNFLTGIALNTIFSILTFILFGVMLLLYNFQIFVIFLTGSFLYFLWIRMFLKIRKKLNNEIFKVSSQENGITLQLVQGMQEIKLNNAERLKRWEWENTQVKRFKLSLKTMSYSQLQQAGALVINQSKDILITFFVAGLVIKGYLTLGAMIAIQYILGQLNSPIEQFVTFIQSGQDASISLDRLNEIHELDIEEKNIPGIDFLPEKLDISLRNLSFAYPGNDSFALQNVNINIPAGKVTAIVGVSGSGKTTLLKLLMKFYDSYSGEICLGDTNLKYLKHSFWRSQCGAVLQDGFIFSDSIARNIAIGDEEIDLSRLVYCAKISNIFSFIESLAMGFETKLGRDGISVSQGQKQRILIARAIYKNPKFIFFDEATNALDAHNEKIITNNLKDVFSGKTIVIVAHRLSTVKNADNIIVLENGKICEEGNHTHLSSKKGKYYNLVKDQLELGT